MRKIYLFCFLAISALSLNAQQPGDTIRVNAFNFNSTVRDTVIDFPSDPDLTFEKVILKYTMRCPDGLVNDGVNMSIGCHQWDFSCNTYLVDSTKIETDLRTIPSHFITNFDGNVFPYKETPSYNYLRGTQTDVQIITTNSETEVSVGNGTYELDGTLMTSEIAGKSQYLFHATELIARGLTAGNIDGLSLDILDKTGEARYLKIKVKSTTQSELNGQIDKDDFTEVYYKNTTLQFNNSNRFNFHTPFNWDGNSNLLVEFNFTNIDGSNPYHTIVKGDDTPLMTERFATNEKEIMLTGSTYVECNDYTGITGSENRTVEAWIKTTDGSNGEILAWGSIITGRKWVFRVANGKLRVEVHGGGTESTLTVDDGEWHHVAAVLDGNTVGDVRFYIDGVLDQNSTTATTVINTSASPVRISRGLSNRYLDAIIDEVRIWNTNLSAATINDWKSLKIFSSHPNYSNLQLYYPFSRTGNQVVDYSDHGRHATIIGQEVRVTHQDGETLFKDFVLGAQRPNVTFFQGDYIVQASNTTVDKPILKDPQHFVLSRTIEPSDPNSAVDDVIVNSTPQEFWSLDEKIFDEATGDLISENILTADGEIVITDLDYYRRFPFYNELVSFVTPYGIGLDLGLEGKSWYMDMSDYVTVLKNNKRVLMTLGGQFNEEMDLEFLFIVGTPPRDVLQYDQIWQGTNRVGIARINDLLDDTKLAPQTIELNPNASTFKLKSSITGHGSEGEFQQNGGAIRHMIKVDQNEIFNWDIQQECSTNPISPQGGTWAFDRQGWCPGQRTFLNEQDLTPHTAGSSSINIDYDISNPQVPAGDYRYHIAHQIVGYGNPNFQVDAAVTSVMAPNNTAEFIRTGTICDNPIISIQNTGATELTQLTINYWLNDSQSPQTFEWTGSLDFMEEEAITIAAPRALWFDVLDADNVFHVEVESPNQDTDEYFFNNKMSSNFDPPQLLPSKVTFEFKTNNASIENSYYMIDGQGSVISSNSLSSPNTIFSDDLELMDDCYKLVVEDTGNDGLEWFANPAQGTGYITFSNENNQVVKRFDPDFGGGFEFNFTTDFALSIDELEFLTSIKLFPNPAQDFCTIETESKIEEDIQLMDALGRTVQATVLSQSDQQVTIDLKNLNTGIYFVVIRKDDLVTTRKLVVE